jgi:hypothetical protein
MSPESEDMRPEYDIRGGTRGKYFQQYWLRLNESPWVQLPATESRGRHRTQSTIQIIAEPIYLTPRLEVDPAGQR